MEVLILDTCTGGSFLLDGNQANGCSICHTRAMNVCAKNYRRINNREQGLPAVFKRNDSAGQASPACLPRNTQKMHKWPLVELRRQRAQHSPALTTRKSAESGEEPTQRKEGQAHELWTKTSSMKSCKAPGDIMRDRMSLEVALMRRTLVLSNVSQQDTSAQVETPQKTWKKSTYVRSQ